MTFCHNTEDNVSLLNKLTNIPSAVCNQWLLCECQATNNPTNPLNIIALDYPGYPERGRIKQTGRLGNFGVYGSPAQGIEDAAWLVNVGYVGKPIREAVAASKSALEIAQAIENSGWAAGHYGHSCISSHFENGSAEDMLVVVTRKPFTTPVVISVSKGSTINGYDPARPGKAIKSVNFDDNSSAHATAEVSVAYPGNEASAPVPYGGPFLEISDGAFKGLLIVAKFVHYNPVVPESKIVTVSGENLQVDGPR